MCGSVTAQNHLDIRFHDTLTDRLEPLKPVHKDEVRIYTCGPTVYDFAHIGNFRTFVFQDILRRFLRSAGYRVLQVMNLTDVDDRIIANAVSAKVTLREPVDGRRNWEGTLAGMEDGVIRLDVDRGDPVCFPFEMVEKANLKFEW